MKTIENELMEHGFYASTTVGDSMWPMLRNRRDTIVLRQPDRELKRYDLPMYHRPTGEYVLHRILHVKEDEYIICGDNRWVKEHVKKDWVLGVVTEFYRGEKKISVTSRGYRFYVHLWCDFYYIRVFLIRICHLAHRLVYTIRKRKGYER